MTTTLPKYEMFLPETTTERMGLPVWELSEIHKQEMKDALAIADTSGYTVHNFWKEGSPITMMGEFHRIEMDKRRIARDEMGKLKARADKVANGDGELVRICKLAACGRTISASGKRGRQPVVHEECREAYGEQIKQATKDAKAAERSGLKEKQAENKALREAAASEKVEIRKNNPKAEERGGAGNMCTGCGNLIPPSGKRGRPAKLCVACKEAK